MVCKKGPFRVCSQKKAHPINVKKVESDQKSQCKEDKNKGIKNNGDKTNEAENESNNMPILNKAPKNTTARVLPSSLTPLNLSWRILGNDQKL